MTMKRSTLLGTFVAHVNALRFGTSGKLLHVEVNILCEVPPEQRVDKSDECMLEFITVNWRGGFTAAAVQRTVRALHAMGATFETEDPMDVTGVGTKPFKVELVKVECDLEETHGTEGVSRVFVHRVMEAT